MIGSQLGSFVLLLTQSVHDPARNMDKISILGITMLIPSFWSVHLVSQLPDEILVSNDMADNRATLLSASDVDRVTLTSGSQ